MPDGRTKRKDGTVGFRVGKFIHSNERMAEIARSSAAQLEYSKRREERARFLAPQTIQATEGVTKVPNTIVDGVEFSPDEVRQVRRLKFALATNPEKFAKVKNLIIDMKRQLAPLEIEIDQESMTKIIGQCL